MKTSTADALEMLNTRKRARTVAPADRHAPGTLVWGERDVVSRRRPEGRVRANRGHRVLVEWRTGRRVGHQWVAHETLVAVF